MSSGAGGGRGRGEADEKTVESKLKSAKNVQLKLKDENAPYMDIDRYMARPYLLASAAGGAAAAAVASASAAAAGAAGSEVSPPKPTFFSHWQTLAGHECRPLSQTDTHLGQGSGSG